MEDFSTVLGRAIDQVSSSIGAFGDSLAASVGTLVSGVISGSFGLLPVIGVGVVLLLVAVRVLGRVAR